MLAKSFKYKRNNTRTTNFLVILVAHTNMYILYIYIYILFLQMSWTHSLLLLTVLVLPCLSVRAEHVFTCVDDITLLVKWPSSSHPRIGEKHHPPKMRRRKSGSNFGATIIPDFKEYRRIMLRRLGRLPKFTQLLLCLSLVLSILLYGWLIYTLLTSPFQNDAFTERDKCPACYGTHLCQSFSQGQMSFSGAFRFPFLHFLSLKNVFPGYYGDRQVVFKRLAHTSELQAFDERLCLKGGDPMDCDVAESVKKVSSPTTKWLMQRLKGISVVPTWSMMFKWKQIQNGCCWWKC